MIMSLSDDRRSPTRRGEPGSAGDTQLIERWVRSRDPEAREALFERFLPLARSLVRRYDNPHEPREDLMQVAAIGLLGAIDRFDSSRGSEFRSYAVPTILGELRRHFRNTGWSAHVPRRAQELALMVERARYTLTEVTGRSPSPVQIAESLEIDLADVMLGLDAGIAHFSSSMDAPIAGSEAEDKYPLHEMIGHHDDAYALVDVKLSLAAVLPQLPWHERAALTLRVQHGLKQTEIAQRIGCSQMQVSRLLRSGAQRAHAAMDPPPAVGGKSLRPCEEPKARAEKLFGGGSSGQVTRTLSYQGRNL
jgi:RNA polymerase sigma-B factor